MNSKINPPGIMPPFNNAYSHAVIIPPNARVLHSAGQVGARPDGTVSANAEEQAEQLWQNLVAILRAADMTVTDIVKLNAYLISTDYYGAYAGARGRHLGEHKPASTAICIPQLIKPEWYFEVELIAAKST